MSISAAGQDDFTDVTLLIRGFQFSKMLQVAATLELADRLSTGPQPVTLLAQDCGADAGMLLRLCRALAAFGVFAVDGEGRLCQTSRSAWLRRDANPSLHYAARYWTTPGNWLAWNELEHAVRTGGSPFERVFGSSSFDYLATHPDEASLFDAFMQHSPDDRHGAVVQAYDFSNAHLIVDVGGGNGALLAAILSANPRIKGLLFDQAPVVANLAAPLRRSDPGDRCQIEIGDFFQSVPAGGDLYVLAQILHDWDDARCLTILGNCRNAMSESAKLLIVERLLADEPAQTNPFNYLADMHMMVILYGHERTQAEFDDLLQRAGFGPCRILSTRSPFHIIETRPA